MKASLKFREEKKPLFRAKVPLSILGFPFQSGIVAGDSKELTLNLSTFFESGPCVKVSYRPNDVWNPFSLVVKTGTGAFGSPILSSLIMSAEFNLLGRGNSSSNNNNNPIFMLHFKPQFGDFSIKKSQSQQSMKSCSVFEKPKVVNGVVSDDEVEVNEEESMPMFKKITTALPSRAAGDVAAGLFSGIEISARTALPVRSRAVVNFRWGVRVPTEMKQSAAGIDLKKIPYLVMNKIGIEHVDGGDKKRKVGPEANNSKNGDVADFCFNVKRQLEMVQLENRCLKEAVEDLRQELVKGKQIAGDLISGKYDREGERKFKEADVNEELKKKKKAINGVTAAA